MSVPLFSDLLTQRRKTFPSRWQGLLHNKQAASQLARKLGISTPSLYSLTDDPERLPEFPSRCVVKPTHGASTLNVFLLHDGFDAFTQRQVTRDEVIEQLKIPVWPGGSKQCLCEEYLEDVHDNAIPLDFKFYVFGGHHIGRIVVFRRLRRGLALTRNYDADFQPLEGSFNTGSENHQDDLLPVPACFEEMKAAALKLARTIGIFVRLDFYATTRGPVFGELTHFPNAGRYYTEYGDQFLGRLWAEYPDNP